MNIQQDINKIRQATKLLFEVAVDTDINVQCQAIVRPGKDDEELSFPQVIAVYLDDWTFEFDSEQGFSCNYQPPISEGHSMFDEWIADVDPRKIISFSMPPHEKSPDTDQSNQGKSIGKLAHEHYTPHVQEVQDE